LLRAARGRIFANANAASIDAIVPRTVTLADTMMLFQIPLARGAALHTRT
jgi:hypothetical protein